MPELRGYTFTADVHNFVRHTEPSGTRRFLYLKLSQDLKDPEHRARSLCVAFLSALCSTF